MPNPELSQYHDHDTDTLYDLRDDTARSAIDRLSYIDFIVCMIESTGHGSDTRVCYTDLTIINGARFDRGKEGTAFRLHCKDSSFWSWTDEKLVYIHILGMQQAHFVPLYTDATKTEIATVGQLRNKTFDFVYICYNGDYENAQVYIVSSLADSADLSNYYTKTETDNLLSAKVSDNPTFTEAATRANIASGETFAVILGKIKKFFSDLKTVAFSGDYNDLSNKPTIPAAQVQSDWNEADNTAADYIKNKPNLATVATSGSYNDLTDKPTIPDISIKMDKSNPTGSGSLSIERRSNTTIGNNSVAVGLSGTASALASFSEGYITTASGTASHAEGSETTASGNQSHAEGYQTEASGRASHAEGINTIAGSDYQHVSGKYNIADNADIYAEIIGNGANSNSRSNARTLDWSGNETIAGDLYYNGLNTPLSSQLSAKADSSSLATVATSGLYSDLSGTPTIPAAQVNSDWNANSGVAEILNKPTLATVATSGLYSDLSGTPTIPSGVDTFVDASLPSLTNTDFGSYSSGRVICPVNTAKSIGTIEVPAGYWILEISAMWYSNGTGYRMLGLSTTKNTFSINKNYTISQNAVNGVETYQRISIVVHPTATTRYHIVVKQNVGDIYVSPEYKAIRLEH